MLEEEGVETWDWILRDLADGNPAEVRRIEQACTPYEIAKAYAMDIYVNSAELKDSAV